MLPWIRNLLFAVVMLCAAIIGARVYLELSSVPAPPAMTTLTPGAPESLPEFTLNDIYGEPRNIREWAGQPVPCAGDRATTI